MADYYFNYDTGGDGGAGTIGDPFQTLTKATELFTTAALSGGDRLLFARGVTWPITNDNTNLHLKGSSGSYGNHIYIGPYGGGSDRPVFDLQADVEVYVVGRWSSDADANYVTIEGLELTNGYLTSIVNLWGCHHYKLLDLYVHHSDAAGSPPAEGISIHHNTHHVLVDGCEVAYCQGEGIYIGNTTAADQDDFTRFVRVVGCTLHDNENEGVDLKGMSLACFVVDTRLEDNASGSGYDYTQFNLGGQHHRVYNCKIIGTRGSNRWGMYCFYTYGAETNKGCRYLRVSRCLFLNSGRANYGALMIRGDDNEFSHLTFVGGAGSSVWMTSHQWTGNGAQKLRNSIFHDSAQYAIRFEDSGVALSNYTVDYNFYDENVFPNGGDDAVYHGAARTLTWFQAQSQEAHGLCTAPSWDEMAEVYSPATGWAGIDAGVAAATLQDWNKEYGSSPTGAPDMGWCEDGWNTPHRIFDSNFLTTDDFSGTSGVSLHADAAYYLATGGLVAISDTASRYFQRSSLGPLDFCNARFYFNADGLTMASSDEFTLLELRDGSDNVLARVNLNYNGSNKRIRAGAMADDDSVSYTGYHNIAAGWNQVEISWARSLLPSEDDWGQIELWLNEAEVEAVYDVDNDTRTVDKVYLGAPAGVDAGTSGNLYVDSLMLDEVRILGSVMDAPPSSPVVTHVVTVPVVVTVTETVVVGP